MGEERHLAPAPFAPDRCANEDRVTALRDARDCPDPVGATPKEASRSARRSSRRSWTFLPVGMAVRRGGGALRQMTGTWGPGGGGFQCRMRA